MGQQQILLIVLSVILVGIAIAVGITMFQSQAEQGNIDSMIADLNNLGAQAYQYYIRPVSMGGGGNTYDGFAAAFAALPPGMKANSNAEYTIEIGTTAADNPLVVGEAVLFIADSASSDNKRWLVVDKEGNMKVYSAVTDHDFTPTPAS